MKPLVQQTHYEILEVPRTATPADVDTAYLRVRRQLGPESLAVYTLASRGEAEAFLERVEASYQVLSDASRRAQYDRSLGDPADVPPPWAPRSGPEQQALPRILAEADRVPRQPAQSPERPAEMRVEAPVAPAAAAPTPALAVPPRPSEAPPLAAEMALETVGRRAEGAGPRSERPRPVEIGPEAQVSGELLRRARESRGLSLHELADRTRITATHLENIEADHYGALPATVYLRGFLMSVARELKLDPVRVARSYLELAERAAPDSERGPKVDAPKRRL